VLNVRSPSQLSLIRKAKAKGIEVTCSVTLSTLFSADADDGAGGSFWTLTDCIDIVTISHDSEIDGASELELAIPLLFGAVNESKIKQADVVR
jgi:dihydroorotase-like cyclic amidohydrolase